jgi:hypothetical protein
MALAVTAASAQAGPLPATSQGLKAQTSDAVQVRWRGGRWGWGVAPWVAGGVVAGAIIADEAYRPRHGHYYDEEAYDGPYYYPSRYDGDPRVVCAENFRSFEWRTGLYTTYSGEKRLCPYLR